MRSKIVLVRSKMILVRRIQVVLVRRMCVVKFITVTQRKTDFPRLSPLPSEQGTGQLFYPFLPDAKSRFWTRAFGTLRAFETLKRG